MIPTLRRRSHHGLEILESRIAPASLTFVDFDGDSVTITTSKGTDADLATAAKLVDVDLGQQLIELDLTPAIFAGTNVTIAVAEGGPGDGMVSVGFLNALGRDLGAVTIAGGLERVFAGDTKSSTAGIKSLTVESFGSDPGLDSEVVGAINTLTVHGNFIGGYLFVRGSDSLNPDPSKVRHDSDGRIGTLTIGGSLYGTARDNGGYIEATGDIGKITVGSYIAGYLDPEGDGSAADGQQYSGSIYSRGKINSVTIGTELEIGGILGGSGERSGQVASASGIGSATVFGSIIGGSGMESGAIGAGGSLKTIRVTGDVKGGLGDRSGTLLGVGTIVSAQIGGNLIGGDGFNSGAIGAAGPIGTVVVTGDVIGGGGASSGQIVSQGTIKSVTVGNLIGGGDFESGAIGSLKGIGSVLIKGDLVAGTGTRSGVIATAVEPPAIFDPEVPVPPPANAPISKITILGSIQGNGVDGGVGIRAGAILSSGLIGSVTVGGDLIGGSNDQTGFISSNKSITSVTIGGRIEGGSGVSSGSIVAAGSISTVQVGDPLFAGVPNEGGPDFSGTGVIGGDGGASAAIRATQLGKVSIYGQLVGGSGGNSGLIYAGSSESGAVIKIGSVLVRGGLIGGTAPSSGTAISAGSIVSLGTIGSVQIGDALAPQAGVFGSSQDYGARIYASRELGTVTIKGDVIGGSGVGSTEIYGGTKIGSVYIGGTFQGGLTEDDASLGAGLILTGNGGSIGSVEIGWDVIGGDSGSGSILAYDGKIGKVTIHGSLLGSSFGSGAIISARVLGPVFIGGNVVGGSSSSTSAGSAIIAGTDSIASVTIGDPKNTDPSIGNLTGGLASNSALIQSYGNIGPVKIKGSVQGGAAANTGRILSGGNIASISIGTAANSGSLVGGPGAAMGGLYFSDNPSNPVAGQIFARGSIGPVTIAGSILGQTNSYMSVGGPFAGIPTGPYAALIHGGSISTVTVVGDIVGGAESRSGGVYSDTNIGTVTAANLAGGGGYLSGSITADLNITAVKLKGSLTSFGYGAGVIAAGHNLGTVELMYFTSGLENARPRISAGDSIGTVKIIGYVSEADILAGYSVDFSPVNPDAQIGKVLIGVPGQGGDISYFVQGLNIVAGIRPGEDGVFGTSDDSAILAEVSTPKNSKIGSVTINGSLSSSGELFRYGFVAETIGSVKISGSALLLHSGALNDPYRSVYVGGSVIYGELPFSGFGDGFDGVGG